MMTLSGHGNSGILSLVRIGQNTRIDTVSKPHYFAKVIWDTPACDCSCFEQISAELEGKIMFHDNSLIQQDPIFRLINDIQRVSFFHSAPGRLVDLDAKHSAHLLRFERF
jgi:hypothetical protein